MEHEYILLKIPMIRRNTYFSHCQSTNSTSNVLLIGFCVFSNHSHQLQINCIIFSTLIMATISASFCLPSHTQGSAINNKLKFSFRRRSLQIHNTEFTQRSRKPLKLHLIPRAAQNMENSVEELNQQIGCEGVKAEEGQGKLPKLVLKSTGGSEAEIYLFGGCVTSWKIPTGKDLLFVRPDAVFNGQKPISGGIPHCFPQFGPGPMQQHGFARNSTWSVASFANTNGNPTVTLELKDSTYTRAMWDFSFLATFQVVLEESNLSTKLVVNNTDNKKFSFSAALHSYFRASVTGALVKGLKDCSTLNKFPDPKNPIAGVESREEIDFPGFVDCVYLAAPERLMFKNGLGDTISIENKNWKDAVLWNPHLQMEACYKDFVCVENAQIGKVELEPGQEWIAEQCLKSS